MVFIVCHMWCTTILGSFNPATIFCALCAVRKPDCFLFLRIQTRQIDVYKLSDMNTSYINTHSFLSLLPSDCHWNFNHSHDLLPEEPWKCTNMFDISHFPSDTARTRVYRESIFEGKTLPKCFFLLSFASCFVYICAYTYIRTYPYTCFVADK